MIEFVNKKTIAVDETLTKKGWAADAEAVGKALAAGGTVGGATEAYVDAAIEDVKNYVDEAIENIDIPEGGGGADVDLSDYYTKEETDILIFDNTKNLATKTYVDEAVSNAATGDIDLNGYYTKEETEELLFDNLGSYATKDYMVEFVDAATGNFATEDYVDNAIANIPSGGGGGDADLSNYYTKEQTNQMIAASNTSAQSYVDSKTKFDNASIIHNEAGALTVSYGGAVIKTQAAQYQPEEGQLPTSNPQWNITLRMPGVPVGECQYLMGVIGGEFRTYENVWIYGAGESGNQDEVSDLISWIATDGTNVTISPGSAFQYNVTQIESLIIMTNGGTTYIPIDGGVIPVDGYTIINDGGILSATLNEARVSELIWEALDSIPNAEEGEY